MRYSNRTIGIAVASVILLIVLWTSLFTVHQTQQVLVLQVGEPRQVVTQPGLHMKLPWPFQNVLYLDRRVLYLDLPVQEVIAQDRKRLVVDAFARWRITDPLRFYQSLTDENIASGRLQPILGSNVRRILVRRLCRGALGRTRQADARHPRRHERGDQKLRHRNRRRAHPPCRSSAAEQ
jgi:membrane protease subunit HflC